MHSCGKIMYTKDSVWKYEKEYRIVTRNHKDIENDMFDSYKNQKGSLHKTQEFNLSLSKVYLGMNCTEENRDKIIETIKAINDSTAESILDGDAQSHNEELYVYDIVLAGVEA